MSDPKAKPNAKPLTFTAPIGLIAKLDQLAEREMTSRASLLRRLAAQATRQEVAA